MWDHVERHIPHVNVTKDLFGFGDILFFGGGKITILQTTGITNFHGRRAKILKNPVSKKWLEAGGAIVLQAWDTKTQELKMQTWGAV